MKQPTSLEQLRDEVKETQKLVLQLVSNDDVDTEEFSFIEKKLDIVSEHLAQHIQQDKMTALSVDDKSLIKLIHQYYIEMVAHVASKKQSVSEELRKLNQKEHLEAVYNNSTAAT